VGLGLAGILDADGLLAEDRRTVSGKAPIRPDIDPNNPYAPRQGHFDAATKQGFSYGESDEFGFKAAVDMTTVYDFNATLLHLMGLDHERLTFYHNGLERRLTNVHGTVVKEVLA
jgi:hypothetical protein